MHSEKRFAKDNPLLFSALVIGICLLGYFLVDHIMFLEKEEDLVNYLNYLYQEHKTEKKAPEIKFIDGNVKYRLAFNRNPDSKYASDWLFIVEIETPDGQKSWLIRDYKLYESLGYHFDPKKTEKFLGQDKLWMKTFRKGYGWYISDLPANANEVYEKAVLLAYKELLKTDPDGINKAATAKAREEAERERNRQEREAAEQRSQKEAQQRFDKLLFGPADKTQNSTSWIAP
ncbi:MAG: hypothetical protein WC471_03370 [Candidatus Woesearchaeota archaeon]